MATALTDSILRAVIYFDLFSYPLTARELYQCLWQPPQTAYSELLEHLSKLTVSGRLAVTFGYYHLPCRGQIIETRRRAFLFQEKKLAIARRLIRKLRYVSGVRMVAVCNTVAAGWPEERSDVDLFIVVRAGRMWITRFLVTLVTTLMNLRRSGNSVANKVCLSFFITDDQLDISCVALSSPDVYLVYWLNQLICVYDADSLHDKLLNANKWAFDHLPYARNKAQDYFGNKTQLLARYKVCDNALSRMVRRVATRLTNGWFGDALERAARLLQHYKMGEKALIYNQQTHGAGVVISDNMLKFHETDKREEYRRQWDIRCKELISNS